MNNKDKKALLHLVLLPGIGSTIVYKICRGLLFQQDPNAVADDIFQNIEVLRTLPFSSLYFYSSAQLQQVFGISVSLADKIMLGLQDTALVDQELATVHDHGIWLCSILDDAYPSLLRTIYMPPLILYVKGRLPCAEDKTIAFVGSRAADPYAAQVIDYLVPPLVQEGWNIISGGAIGVDTLAHKVVVQNGGKTVAVLGSGLLNLYPRSNKKLFDAIVAQGGAVVSPFSLYAEPMKGNFPARNRIIAGLSQGTVVVRAAKKSGALITAQFCLEQGRQVFTVPGSIFDELSQGCHQLLVQGAKAVTHPNDIFEEFGEKLSYYLAATNAASLSDQAGAQFPLKHDEEDPILRTLTGALTFDELSLKTGLSFDDLQDKLFHLQLLGKVKQNFAGFWEKNL